MGHTGKVREQRCEGSGRETKPVICEFLRNNVDSDQAVKITIARQGSTTDQTRHIKSHHFYNPYRHLRVTASSSAIMVAAFSPINNAVEYVF